MSNQLKQILDSIPQQPDSGSVEIFQLYFLYEFALKLGLKQAAAFIDPKINQNKIDTTQIDRSKFK